MSTDSSTIRQMADPASPLLLVRATVNLPELPYGHAVCVDPTLPTIRDWLIAGYLVAFPQDQQHHCADIAIEEPA